MSKNSTFFFSVCIPATNREKTIYNTLCSLCFQEYKDFEVIVVNCHSTDRTANEIERFFTSEQYKKAPFVYQYKQLDYTPHQTEDWNDPIRYASGRYIAMLEGDDQYTSEHLQNAHNILTAYPNIGLYATSNQTHIRVLNGVIGSDIWLADLLRITDIPTPSESIFIRFDNNLNLSLYDASTYLYCPEVALYIDLAIKGYDAYYCDKTTVWRHPSVPKKYDWTKVKDNFTILHKYHNKLSKKIYRNTRNRFVFNSVNLWFGSSRSFCDLPLDMWRTIGVVRLSITIFAIYCTKFYRKLLRTLCKNQ